MRIKAYAKYKLRRFYRFFVPKRIVNYSKVRSMVRDKIGIEVGGPSKIFNDIVKVYTVAERVDGCNFSTNTIWEGSIKEGNPYVYDGNQLGSQYISDATDLSKIPADKYDFLLSSHCLEHVANPIRALNEWNRVIKPGGLMVLALPNPEFTFDHNRARTTFEHILNDYKNETEESDETHVQDVIDNCDISRVFIIGTKTGETISREEHVRISRDNHNLRAIHHHVYTDDVVYKMMNEANFKVMASEHFPPFHMIYLGIKV